MSGGPQDPFQSSDGGAPEPNEDTRMAARKAGQQAGPIPGELLPRLGARLIDTIPFSILGFALNAAFDLGLLLALIQVVVAYAYFVLLDTYVGTTVGKRLLRLRVTSPTGDRPDLKQAAIREAFILVGGVPVVGSWLALLVWILIAVTINKSPTKQGKHDELAGGTRVIKA